MLPEFYRFIVKNSTDQTFTYNNAARIEVHITPWKMTGGAMVQGALIEDTTDFLDTAGALTAGSITEGAAHDNTSNLYIGFTGLFYCIADANSTDGTMDLYMEWSYDNAIWPSDLADYDMTLHTILLAKLPFTTDAEDEGAAIPISY